MLIDVGVHIMLYTFAKRCYKKGMTPFWEYRS